MQRIAGLSGADQERELVARSCRGDTAAFEQIYRRYGNAVMGIAWRLTLDRARAEDLTQEAFVQIWQQLDAFRFESALATWIHRVATHVVLADLRRSGRRQRLVPVDAEYTLDDTAAPNVDPAGGRDIEQQLQRLPERARMVLVLHDLAGFTHEEIGEALEIAPGTSKAQLFRARRMYRELDNEQ